MTPTIATQVKPFSPPSDVQFKIQANRHAVGLAKAYIIYTKRRQPTPDECRIIEEFMALMVNLSQA